MSRLMINGRALKMRKNPFDACRDGIFMSKNGNKAFNRGEKPLFMWGDNPPADLVPTVPHHIGRTGSDPAYSTFELVMFYRSPSLEWARLQRKADVMAHAEVHSRTIVHNLTSGP